MGESDTGVVRAPKAGSLPRLSPSGVKSITRCMTRWWFEKVAKRSTPTTPAQAIGLKIHERAENFVTTGSYGVPEDDPFLHLVKPGEKFLRDLREGFLHRGGSVEKLYEIPRGEWAVPVYCRTDYVEPGLVVDHKSTRDIYSPYIPTPFDLAKDDQMLWYGYLEWRHAKNPPVKYEVQHTYFSSESPASRVVRVLTTWDKTLKVAEKFAATAKVMYDAAQILTPGELEYSLDACGDYGGCPHHDYCPHVSSRRSGGLAGLRERLKRRADDPNPNRPDTQRQERKIMGFRDRRAAELQAAAEAAKAETTPVPGEGQGNAADSPGTETPTDAQIEEMCEVILNALGPKATNPEITKWLTTDGSSELTRVGLGRVHIARVLRFWTGDTGAEDEADETPAPAAAKPAPAPAATKPAAAKPAAVESDDMPEGADVVLEYLKACGGKVRIDDKDLAAIIREATGAGRLTTQARNAYLGDLTTAGLLDYTAAWVFLPEHFEEMKAPKATPAPAAIERPSVVAARAAESVKPAPAPVASDDDGDDAVNQITGAYPFVLCVGALPQGTAIEVETIDDVLGDYYDVADAAAVDENGQKVGSHLLWAYGKGPRTIAAQVRGDVREGRVPDVRGVIFVPKGHFMSEFLSVMFPGATVFRGV